MVSLECSFALVCPSTRRLSDAQALTMWMADLAGTCHGNDGLTCHLYTRAVLGHLADRSHPVHHPRLEQSFDLRAAQLSMIDGCSLRASSRFRLLRIHTVSLCSHYEEKYNPDFLRYEERKCGTTEGGRRYIVWLPVSCTPPPYPRPDTAHAKRQLLWCKGEEEHT